MATGPCAWLSTACWTEPTPADPGAGPPCLPSTTRSALAVRSEDGNWVWAFGLYPDGKHTRLVSRNRIKTPGASAPARLAYTVVMEPGSLVMERKMLLSIKQRAERLAAAPTQAA